MGYEAMTGRLPDQVALHFLDSGLVGKVETSIRSGVAKARTHGSRRYASGIRAAGFEATPGARMVCTRCPFRDICPSSVARPR